MNKVDKVNLIGDIMYLISAYFDEKTNDRIKRLITNVAKTSGNNYMIDGNVPPHMTICAISSDDEAGVRDDFIDVLSKGDYSGGEIDVDIVSIGILNSRTIYLAVIINNALLDLSTRFNDKFSDRPSSLSKFYKPSSWLAHITLAKTLDRNQLVLGLESVIDDFTPIKGRIVSIGLSKTNPYRDLERLEL